MEKDLIINEHDEFLEHVSIVRNTGNNKKNICYISHPSSNIIFDYELGYDFLLFLKSKKVEVINF